MFVWIMLHSLKLLISPLFRARISLTSSQLQSVYSLLNMHVIWQNTQTIWTMFVYKEILPHFTNWNFLWKLRQCLSLVLLKSHFWAQRFCASLICCLKINIVQNATLMLGLCWWWYVKLWKVKKQNQTLKWISYLPKIISYITFFFKFFLSSKSVLNL